MPLPASEALILGASKFVLIGMKRTWLIHLMLTSIPAPPL